jgi:hypothetical protein
MSEHPSRLLLLAPHDANLAESFSGCALDVEPVLLHKRPKGRRPTSYHLCLCSHSLSHHTTVRKPRGAHLEFLQGLWGQRLVHLRERRTSFRNRHPLQDNIRCVVFHEERIPTNTQACQSSSEHVVVLLLHQIPWRKRKKGSERTLCHGCSNRGEGASICWG